MSRKIRTTTLEQRETMARYYQANKERLKAKSRLQKDQTREHCRERNRAYNSTPERRAARNARERLIYDTSDARKIECAVRVRVTRVARLALRSAKISGRTVQLLGCTIGEFREYISAKFQPGMTWDNFGAWHLDHKLPRSLFDMRVPSEVQRCFHFSNYQPLWAEDNMRKGASISATKQTPSHHP